MLEQFLDTTRGKPKSLIYRNRFLREFHGVVLNLAWWHCPFWLGYAVCFAKVKPDFFGGTRMGAVAKLSVVFVNPFPQLFTTTKINQLPYTTVLVGEEFKAPCTDLERRLLIVLILNPECRIVNTQFADVLVFFPHPRPANRRGGCKRWCCHCETSTRRQSSRKRTLI